MNLYSWNVNGIRACHKNGFLDFISRKKPDLVCLQEIKALPEQVPDDILSLSDYSLYWHPAQKKGYSGVALLSKSKPLSVLNEIGVQKFDDEGRVLIAEYPYFFLINAYFPNSQRDHARLSFKLEFCKAIHQKLTQLEKEKPVVLCGDFNIAHQEIDLKNPKSNQNNAGFLPEERSWMEGFLKSGYVDTFRHFFPTLLDQYTWWSYRPGVREKNIGWRLDYFVTSSKLSPLLKSAQIHPQVFGSDHCPIQLKIDA